MAEKNYSKKHKLKKSLGQHFLMDKEIAGNIARSLSAHDQYKYVLEVGPGQGCLTEELLKNKAFTTYVIEIDKKLTKYLRKEFPEIRDKVIEGDFLDFDLGTYFTKPFALIGNFPYNISSQILFKALENRNMVKEMVGMFQMEVAKRITGSAGSKNYGILSVFIQSFYHTEYLFEVEAESFSPKPKIRSAVVRFIRNDTEQLDCNEKLFFKIVKASFSKRRKMLRNALKDILIENTDLTSPTFNQRAEQLDVEAFVALTNLLEDKILYP